MTTLEILFKSSSTELSRYRQEDEVYCIDLYLTNLLQLFDRRDPSPFREKDLDEDFAKYLRLAVDELPNDAKEKIVIKMPDHNPLYIRVSEVEEAIQTYFAFEKETAQLELTNLFQVGRVALFMALPFLLLITSLAIFVTSPSNPIILALHQGLQVMGWVALWRPLSIFLYEWWPYVDKIKVLDRLTRIKIELITG